MARPSHYPFYGMLGMMQHPHPKSYQTAVFAAADQDCHELDCFITEPGSYDTIMSIATLVQFEEIHLFVTNMDIRFYSDIYRIMADITKVRPDKKVYFHFPNPYDGLICLPNMGQKVGFNYTSSYQTMISMEYIVNGKETRELLSQGKYPLHHCSFDMKINLGDHVAYIPAKIPSFDELPEIDRSLKTEFLLPFSYVPNGGLSYQDIHEKSRFSGKLAKEFMNYRVSAYSSPEEYRSFHNQGWVQNEDIFYTRMKLS